MTGNGHYPPPPQEPRPPQRPPSRPWPPPGYGQPQPQGGGGYGQPQPGYGQPYPPGPAQPPYAPQHGHPYPQQPPPPPPGAQWPPQQPAPSPPPPMPPAPPMPPQGPYGQWPQPRKKSGMGVVGVVGAVFASVAALFVLIVIGAAVFKGSSRHTPVAIPSYSPDRYRTPFPEETTSPTDDSSDEPTSPPSSEPTPTHSTEPRTTVTLNTSLKNNTLYRAGTLPRISCPAGNANVFSHSQLKALILKTGRCMDRAWGPIMQRQGIPFRPPSYAIAATRGRGACGDYPAPGNMVPYYCPRNNTIYASTSAMARGNGNARGYGQIIQWNGGIISMMAHEYGHHVQNISGLMNSWWDQTSSSSSRSGKLALSRRLELQATCFGGMWMRSVAASYPVSAAERRQLFSFYGQVGDYPGWPRDHGTPVNNNRWFRQGWERNQAFQCNTWMAPSSTTS
ncbi:neutral zinc metallopeptidase [Nonomuraea sp. NPDC005983]|uniref:neutral zinc metallopeptidase n=1 Tax=Nonomuraea sp. NPDC005983 TaxID=3155595 RepID=UPI0033B8EBA7